MHPLGDVSLPAAVANAKGKSGAGEGSLAARSEAAFPATAGPALAQVTEGSSFEGCDEQAVMTKGDRGVKFFSCWCCAVMVFTANLNQEAPGSVLALQMCLRCTSLGVSGLTWLAHNGNLEKQEDIQEVVLKSLLRPYLLLEIVFSDEEFWYSWKAIKWSELLMNGEEKKWAQLTAIATDALGPGVRSVYSRCGFVPRMKNSVCLPSVCWLPFISRNSVWCHVCFMILQYIF